MESRSNPFSRDVIINPYEASPGIERASQPAVAHGGMGRLGYFFATCAISVVAVGFAIINPLLGFFVGAILTAIASRSRLENLGMNTGWAMLAFLPVANWFLWMRCQAFPAGYAQTHTLDTTARVIFGLALGMFGLIMLLIVFSAIMGR
jgi:hypothetical protein